MDVAFDRGYIGGGGLVHSQLVLPIKPSNVNSSHVKALSATLIWKQVYNCDEEKATKYHVKVANKPELSRLINHSFGNTSPSMCEHVLTGLQPGQTYHVVIIAGNESGTVFSDDISVQTLKLPTKPTNVTCTKIKSHFAKLSWEQSYDSEEEKPTKYHIKVIDKPELSQAIVNKFGDTSPSMCAYTLKGLQPGQTYSVIITAECEGGSIDSDELSLQTSVSVEDILLTVPEKTITSDSAKVHWVVPNHSHFAKSTFTLSFSKSTALGWFVDNAKLLHLKSDSGSRVFENLSASTTYKAKLIICPFPGKPRAVIKESYPFKTQVLTAGGPPLPAPLMAAGGPPLPAFMDEDEEEEAPLMTSGGPPLPAFKDEDEQQEAFMNEDEQMEACTPMTAGGPPLPVGDSSDSGDAESMEDYKGDSDAEVYDADYASEGDSSDSEDN